MNDEPHPAHGTQVGAEQVDAPATAPRTHPVRLVVTDDLERSRLTVFFRLILAIPHFIWLSAWSLALFFLAIANWVIALVKGRPSEGLHRLSAMYVRYTAHVYAYVGLAANPYPGFLGNGPYPVDVELPAEPEPQDRWRIALRLVLAIPALMLAATLNSGGPNGGGSGGGDREVFVASSIGVLTVVGLLLWFVILFRRRAARGLRDLAAYAIGYGAQAGAYLLLVTGRYPNSDPLALGQPAPLDPHPIELTADDDLRRTRLTVFFRLLLAFPHFAWLVLWGVAAVLAAFANWLFAVVAGRPAAPLHRFLGAYVRYQAHVTAFVTLVANPFPGFTGRPGTYPVDVLIDPPAPQSRWRSAFRLLLAIPAFMVSGALGAALFCVALFGWFASLFTARMPNGLRNLGAFVIRYSAQVNGYANLLTESYPYSGPGFGAAPPEAAVIAEVA